MKNPFVTLSSPREKNLSANQKQILSALIKRIENEGLSILPESPGGNLEGWCRQINVSQGCVVLAFSQWDAHRLYRNQDRAVIIPSESTHITLTIAMKARKPLLVIREKQVHERGTLSAGYAHPIVDLPNSATADWLKTRDFEDSFALWLKTVHKQKHVFLGYSSQARTTANEITRFLTEKGFTILDWQDFQPSEVVLSAIEDAERLTACGVFLFMADDHLEGVSSLSGVPRDNVVYEAGYFAGAKGPKYTLIIREKDAKVPTDLAGVLYLELRDRDDIGRIETKLVQYIEDVFE